MILIRRRDKTEFKIEKMTLRYFQITFILIVFSCTTYKRSMGNNLPYVNVSIELNQDKLSVFGLPINPLDLNRSLIYCLRDNLELKDTLPELGVIKLLKNNSIIKVSFKNDSEEINGQFFVPSFQQVQFTKHYSAEDFKITMIEPYYVYGLIRSGEWNYYKNGVSSTIDYNQIIRPLNFECKENTIN